MTWCEVFVCIHPQEAFDWRRRKGQGPVPNLYDYEAEEAEKQKAAEEAAATTRILDNIDGQVTAAKVGVAII